MSIISRHPVRPLAANAVLALLLASCTANTPATAPLEPAHSSAHTTSHNGATARSNGTSTGGATTSGEIAISRSGAGIAFALGTGFVGTWTVTTVTTSGTAPSQLIVQKVAQEVAPPQSNPSVLRLRLPQSPTVATFTPSSFLRLVAAWSAFDDEVLLRDGAAAGSAAPAGASIPAALGGAVNAVSAAEGSLRGSQAQLTAATRQLTALQQEASAAVSTLANPASSSPSSARTGLQGAALGSIAALQGGVATVRGAILAVQGSVAALVAAEADAQRAARSLALPTALPAAAGWGPTSLAVQHAEAIAVQSSTAAQRGRRRSVVLQAQVPRTGA